MKESGRLPSIVPSWLAARRYEALIVVVFVASRFAFSIFGVRFDTGPLNYAGQILDPGRLRGDLFGAIANLHTQPPLFNLFIGLVLRVPYSWEAPTFHLVYLVLGLALALGAYGVLRRFGVGPKVAVALAIALILSPSVVLFENWLLYDYPVMVLLVLAVLALQRFEDRHASRDAVAFLGLLAVLVLTRSLFNLLWLLLWAGLLMLHRRHADWRRIAVIAAVPILAVVAMQANNARISGGFTSSSSLGVSLSKVTTFQLTDDLRQELVDEGQLSPLAMVYPLSPVSSYRGLVPPRPPTGVGVLDDEMKGGYHDALISPNLNNILFVDVSNGALRDARRTLQISPRAYLRGMATAYDLFFRPGSDVLSGSPNADGVAWLQPVYRVVYGVTSQQGHLSGPDPRVQYRQASTGTAWLLVVAYAVALMGGLWGLWRCRRGDIVGQPPLVLAFLWSTIAYVVVLSNAVEVGENTRFQMYTEPLVILLVAALVVLMRRRRAGTALTTSSDI
ncbi:MAG: hypothetical protein ACR2G7_11515 [Acidimicrobiales bacterium]